VINRDSQQEQGTAERIRDAAAALFRENGFNGTSMQALATAVGVTKSSLYHHYPSKQALLAAIIEVTMSRVTPLVREIAESDLSASLRLHRALELHTVESIRERDHVACFREESRYLSPDFMATHRQKRDEYEVLFRQTVEEGIDNGEFLAQDPALATMALLGMCDSVIRRYRPAGRHTPDEIALAFADTALRGLGTPAAAGVATGEAAR